MAATAVGAVLLAGAVGIAVAQTSGEGSNVASDGQELSQEQLEAISVASQGKVGEKPPPCPSAEVVDQLKSADLKVGPCAPIPPDFSDQQRQELLERYPEIERKRPDTTDPASVDCPSVSVFGEGDRGYVIEKDFPCGPGARIVEEGDIEVRDGRACMPVTWQPSSGEEARTEWVCEGDAPMDPQP